MTVLLEASKEAANSAMSCAARLVTLGCILVVASGCSDGIPSAEMCDAIAVDMPHGAWRIHVYPDGSATYGYGALPEVGRIKTGTFDFQSVHADLSTRVMGERDVQQEIHGTVQFCVEGEECGRLWYFYDRELAAELFDLAYQNRAGYLFGGEEDWLTIDRFWSERDF